MLCTEWTFTVLQFCYKTSVVFKTLAVQWVCPAFKAKATQATVNLLYTSFLYAL